MATVTSYTAARMKEIEDQAIVQGGVIGDDLILTKFNGVQINAGNVRGSQGPAGITGDTAIQIVTSITHPSSPYEGLVIYETDSNHFYSWDGSAWIYRGGKIVCTSTTRPAILIWEGLKIYETDTKREYVWNGTAWTYSGGTIICTSSTRPASPFIGLTIYETNTFKSYTWNGSTWIDNNPKAMRCKVKRIASQGITSGVISNIVWTNEEYDSDGLWSLGGSSDRIIIPATALAGSLWRYTLNAQWSVNASGIRSFGIMHNNTTNIALHNTVGNPSWFVGGSISGELQCNPGDYVVAFVYQSSGSVLNIDTTYPVTFSASQVI